MPEFRNKDFRPHLLFEGGICVRYFSIEFDGTGSQVVQFSEEGGVELRIRRGPFTQEFGIHERMVRSVEERYLGRTVAQIQELGIPFHGQHVRYESFDYDPEAQ